ncbi:ABC transporter substrate-binding protein [Polynucleobacter paneuropaeus]|nr:ABC transporter substrate-binding protein [Polynucleobacter paneuropaeus]
MTKKQIFLYLSGLAILVAIAVAVVKLFLLPPSSIDIAAGPKGSYLYETAQIYAQEFEKSGVKVTVLETNGTLDNLSHVDHPDKLIEFGFLEGGVADRKDYPSLESLGSIAYAPIWVFYRSQLGDVFDVNGLKGKRIAIGYPTQGIHTNSLDILNAVGINAKNTQLIDIGSDDALKKLHTKEIDALFYSAPAEDRLVKTLFNDPTLKPLKWPDAEGIARNLREYHVLNLPFGAIDLANSKPATDMKVLATTITVITKKDTHSALIYLMMGVMDDIHEKPSILHAENEFPSDKDVDFPMSDDAEDYYKKGGKPFLQRYLPYWAASFLGKLLLILVPLLAIFYPLSQAYPALQQWYYTNKVNRFYDQLVKLEKRLDHHADLDRIKYDIQILRAEIELLIKLEKIPSMYTNLLYDLRGHVSQVIEQHGLQ